MGGLDFSLVAKAHQISLCTWKHCGASDLPSCDLVRLSRLNGDMATKAAWQLSFAPMDHHQVYRHSTKSNDLQSNTNFAANRPAQSVGLCIIWIMAAVLTLHAGNAEEPLR